MGCRCFQLQSSQPLRSPPCTVIIAVREHGTSIIAIATLAPNPAEQKLPTKILVFRSCAVRTHMQVGGASVRACGCAGAAVMNLQFLFFYQEIPFAATCQIMGTCDCWESDPSQLNRIVSGCQTCRVRAVCCCAFQLQKMLCWWCI